MSIENRHQLENTRTKLQELEQLYAKTSQGPATSDSGAWLALVEETDQSIQRGNHSI
jgi:hypothetical protein